VRCDCAASSSPSWITSAVAPTAARGAPLPTRPQRIGLGRDARDRGALADDRGPHRGGEHVVAAGRGQASVQVVAQPVQGRIRAPDRLCASEFYVEERKDLA